MKNLILRILSPVISVLIGFSAAAQVVVSQTDITRQPEGTLPTNNWVGYTSNTGAVAFVQGPGVAPLGCGSVQLSTPAGNDKAWLYNYEYIGTRLADITALFYLTNKTAGMPIQVASINLEIDFNGPEAAGGYSVLVYEPYYNIPPGPLPNGIWQTWDAYDSGRGIWWATRPINGVCASDCFVTWNHILANNPEAIIIGGFGLNQGTGNPGLISAVDVLGIGVSGTTTIYDFDDTQSTTFYADKDGDGYGDANNPVRFCAAIPPPGYVTNNYDCDDTDGKKKVLVCHKGISICINENALPAHIKLGGQPGPCTSPLVVDITSLKPALAEVFRAFAFPNPTRGAINVQLPEIKSSQAEIIVMNAKGGILERRTRAAAGQAERFDLNSYGQGLFLIRVITANSVENLKVLVQ